MKMIDLLPYVIQLIACVIAVVTAYWKTENRVNKMEAEHRFRLMHLEKRQDKQEQKLDEILETVSEIKVLLAKRLR